MEIRVYRVENEYVVADQGGWVEGTYVSIPDAIEAVPGAVSKRVKELRAEVERLSQRPSVEEIVRDTYQVWGSPALIKPMRRAMAISALALFPTVESGDDRG